MVYSVYGFKYSLNIILINLTVLINKSVSRSAGGHSIIEISDYNPGYPMLSEIEYREQSSEYVLTSGEYMRTHRGEGFSTYEKETTLFGKHYRDEQSFLTLLNLIYQMMLLAHDVAVHKWTYGIPVQNKTEEMETNNFVTETANNVIVLNRNASVSKILLVYEDVLDTLKTVQFSLISDWNVKRVSKKNYMPKYLKKKYKKSNKLLKSDVKRLHDYTLTSIAVLADFMRENLCTLHIGLMFANLHNKLPIKQKIHYYGLSRSVGRMCEIVVKHPKKKCFKTFMCPDLETIRDQFRNMNSSERLANRKE